MSQSNPRITEIVLLHRDNTRDRLEGFPATDASEGGTLEF